MAVGTGAWAVTWVGAALLLVAGLAKVRRPVATADALAMSGFPSSTASARLLGVGEAVLGAVVLATGHPAGAAASGLAYLAFAVVAGRLLRAGGSSCGCFGEVDAPLSRLHVVVDAVFAVGGGLAATGAAPPVEGTATLLLAVVIVGTGAMLVRALLVLVPALADGMRRLESA